MEAEAGDPAVFQPSPGHGPSHTHTHIYRTALYCCQLSSLSSSINCSFKQADPHSLFQETHFRYRCNSHSIANSRPLPFLKELQKGYKEKERDHLFKMRTYLALLASALLATPSVLALPGEEWWPSMSKHWGYPQYTPPAPPVPPTTDCSTSTSTPYWTPPAAPETTTSSSTPYETPTPYKTPTPSESPPPYKTSTPEGAWTTSTTSSTTSSPGGYVANPYTGYPAPPSVTGYGAGIGLTPPPPTYPIVTPSVAGYGAPNTTTALSKPTYAVPVGGAAQKQLSFSAVMVGAVGVLFAML